MNLSGLTDAQLTTMIGNLATAHASAVDSGIAEYTIPGMGVKRLTAKEILDQISAVSEELDRRNDITDGVELVEFDEPGLR